MFRIAHKDPFHLSGKLNQAWGVLSPELRLDGSLARWSDFDLSLAILAEERRLLIDNRFFFDCGAVLAGRGGIAGTITSQEVQEAERALKRRWGAYWVTPQGSDSRRIGRKGIKRKSPHVK